MLSGQISQFKKILDENDVYAILVELSTRQNSENLRRLYLASVSYIDSKSEDKSGLSLLLRTQALAKKECEKDASLTRKDILVDVNQAVAKARRTEELREIEEAKNIGFGI